MPKPNMDFSLFSTEAQEETQGEIVYKHLE